MSIAKILIHGGLVFAFLFSAALYFQPVAFGDKSLGEHDNVQARGMQAELHKYKKTEGKTPKWTNQVFVGMPSYQIYGPYQNNIIEKFFKYVTRFGTPVNTPHIIMFLMMLLTYIGLMAMGVDKWLSAVGALSFGFMTNNLVLFEAGHSTKLHAMVYMAPVIGGALLAFRGKRMLLGASLVAFCLTGQIAANHLQITYYTFLILGIMGLCYLVDALMKKTILKFAKSTGLLVVAGLLAILCNLSTLWTTYEYSQETIRGGSNLTPYVLEEGDVKALIAKGLSVENAQKLQQARAVGQTVKTEKFFLERMAAILGTPVMEQFKADLLSLAKSKADKGLDKDYIFNWSYGKMETFTLLVPHFYGGANGKFFADNPSKRGFQLNKNSHSAKAIKKMLSNVSNMQERAQVEQQMIGLTSQYWGDQPFTSGPVYFGAIICFLMILGLLMYKGPFKWALAISLLFLTILAWGKNFEAFNYFMVDYFPMYNKFRAVSMALSAAQVLATILAIMGLMSFLNFGKNQLDEKARKGVVMNRLFTAMKMKPSAEMYLYFAAGITAFFCFIAIAFSYTSDLISINDGRLDGLVSQAPQWAELVEAIRADRASMIRSDAIRSLIFIALAAGVMWAFATNKFKESLIVIAAVGSLSLIDLVMVDFGYVNKHSYERKSAIAKTPPATKADLQIMKDKDPHFRVFDLIPGARKGGNPGNPFANSEGAFYHKVIGGYHAAKPILLQEMVEQYVTGNDILTDKRHLLEMLNVKYVIQSPEVAANAGPIGNAWFVEAIDKVPNADAEFVALEGLMPRSRAVTQQSNEGYLQGLSNQPTAGDYIRLLNYHPERLTYESNTGNERFAVFSEIYYPPHKGWHVYIDGQRAEGDFIKVNYLLRGMRVPAGKHTIEMRFEPRSFAIGETLALICSLLIFAFLAFAIWQSLKAAQEEERPNNLKEV